MNKDQFITKHLDELVGLLLHSFSKSDKTSHRITDEAWASDGKIMMDQMRRGREMLGRMWESLQPPKEKPK